MADQYQDFPAVATHGGQFIQYNIFGNCFEITTKYRHPIMPIGRGAYGIVCSVLNSENNEMVAIKKIANAFDNYMDAKRTLREIKLLRHLDHDNVVAIRDVIPPPLRREFSDVYIATELMDTDLHQIIRSNQNLSEEHSQYFLYQILRGLKYIHSANVIHRDLKPSNLLLNANCDLKICDFGLARPTAENEFMTEYVVTRWYRAPELLLNSSEYTAAIDVWSVGCIFMELMNRKPFLAGNDHVHQMHLLIELLGIPTDADLEFNRNEDAIKYIRQLPRQPLAKIFLHVNPLAIDLIDEMLTINPRKRITGGREICRTLFKKESMAGSCSKENANDSDNDGDCSFSGSSKTFNPEKTVQEKKSWLNYELIGKEVSKVKITVDKEKVKWLKASRDYSFLSSDNDKSMINPNPWMVKNVSKSRASIAKKKPEESRKAKATPKPQVLSSKPWSKESDRFKNSGQSNLEGRVLKRKQVIYDSEDDDGNVDDINVDSDIRKEESWSAKIARKEDVQERKRS